MIQPKKVKRRHRDAQRTAAVLAQDLLNKILWQIISEQAKKETGYDGDITSATLTVPIDEIKDVPKNFRLQIKQEEDNLLITAGVKEEKNIILLGENVN